MRHKDQKSHVSPAAHHGPLPALEHGTPHLHEAELSALACDRMDSFGNNWETAWIDIGGEG